MTQPAPHAKDPAHPHPGSRMPKIPDKTTLGAATLLAAVIAVAVLVLFILPAEYGIDPLRFGQLTGIGDLYDDDHELELGGVGAVHHPEPTAPRNDTFTFQLGGLADNEFKLHLGANQTLLYAWSASGPVNFDFHGDPDAPSRPGEFASYQVGQGLNASGGFQAPFDGRHGWYFQNVADEPVTIILQTWGYYDVIGLLD